MKTCRLTAFDLSSPERFRRKLETELGITPNVYTQADIAEVLRLIEKLAVPAPTLRPRSERRLLRSVRRCPVAPSKAKKKVEKKP